MGEAWSALCHDLKSSVRGGFEELGAESSCRVPLRAPVVVSERDESQDFLEKARQGLYRQSFIWIVSVVLCTHICTHATNIILTKTYNHMYVCALCIYLFRYLFISLRYTLYIYIYIYVHTHTHTRALTLLQLHLPLPAWSCSSCEGCFSAWLKGLWPTSSKYSTSAQGFRAQGLGFGVWGHVGLSEHLGARFQRSGFNSGFGLCQV